MSRIGALEAPLDGQLLVVRTPGDVHQQRAAQVGVLLELLHIQPILPGPHLPIDVPQVVASRVFAMLQEFDRLPEVGAAVHAGEEALHDVAGDPPGPIAEGYQAAVDVLAALHAQAFVHRHAADADRPRRDRVVKHVHE